MAKPDLTYIAYIATEREEWQASGREGWSLILSSLKTLLETGRALPPVMPKGSQ